MSAAMTMVSAIHLVLSRAWSAIATGSPCMCLHTIVIRGCVSVCGTRQRMRRTARCLMAAIQADQGLFSLRLRTGGRHMRPWAFLVQSCRIILSFHPASRRNDSEIYGRRYGYRTNC